MRRVLLVADTPWVVNDVLGAVSDPDVQVDVLDNGYQVLEYLKEADYDVVIADLQVGTMGGMAVTRAIRDAGTMQGVGRVPVVMLLDRAADAFLARRAGADAWLKKPFVPQELRAILEAVQAPAAG
jgi:DNA-binding response OmpR family regulator